MINLSDDQFDVMKLTVTAWEKAPGSWIITQFFFYRIRKHPVYTKHSLCSNHIMPWLYTLSLAQPVLIFLFLFFHFCLCKCCQKMTLWSFPFSRVRRQCLDVSRRLKDEQTKQHDTRTLMHTHARARAHTLQHTHALFPWKSLSAFWLVITALEIWVPGFMQEESKWRVLLSIQYFKICLSSDQRRG